MGFRKKVAVRLCKEAVPSLHSSACLANDPRATGGEASSSSGQARRSDAARRKREIIAAVSPAIIFMCILNLYSLVTCNCLMK